MYIVTAVIITVMGIAAMFSVEFFSGLLTVVIGNVALRVAYELIMMFIILCKKTVSIDKKLDKIAKFYGCLLYTSHPHGTRQIRRLNSL